jgi:hypothetical protein
MAARMVKVKGCRTILPVLANYVLASVLAVHLTAMAHWVRFAGWVVMKTSEYEERFQRPVPSWHQLLKVNRGPSQSRRRRWRVLVAAALIAVVSLTTDLVSHHAAHSHPGTALATGPAFEMLRGELRRILDLLGTRAAPRGPA